MCALYSKYLLVMYLRIAVGISDISEKELKLNTHWGNKILRSGFLMHSHNLLFCYFSNPYSIRRYQLDEIGILLVVSWKVTEKS